MLFYDWRLTGNYFVLSLSTSRLTTRDLAFATEHMRPWSLCNVLSDERMVFSLMNMLGLLSSVRVAHIQYVTENSSLCNMYKSFFSPGFAKQIITVISVRCYAPDRQLKCANLRLYILFYCFYAKGNKRI
jgi:hypothetical protein